MRWIYEPTTSKHDGGYFLGLEDNELKALQNSLKTRFAHVKKRYEYYCDKHESGYATELEVAKMFKWGKELGILSDFLNQK